MATQTRPVKKTSNVAKLTQEIENLHEAIEELHEDVRKIAPKSGIHKAGMSFLNGILKGLGFLIGTTLVAAILIWGLSKALNSQVVQDWIGNTIQDAVSTQVEKAVPEITEGIRDSLPF